LKKIFEKYDTDKKTHGYIPLYEDAFKKHRSTVKRFVEIGVHRGESLRAWRDYFPNAHIIGIEINPKSVDDALKNEPRITLEIGDATDTGFVRKLINKYKNFDIVLDDGSHKSTDMRKSFNLLWPVTNLIYCIEDLTTQYPKNKYKGRPYDMSFIPDVSYMTDLRALIDSLNTMNSRMDIFKICFYKWQVYIHRR